MSQQDINADLEQLYEETVSMVYNLGLRLFKSEDEAMDFTQEVYLKAFSQLDKFQGRSKFSTWLYSLALNFGLNSIKKKKKIRFVDKGIEELHLASEYDLVLQLDEEEQIEMIQQKLQELPEMYRLPLILFYYEKLSYVEIAKKLGIKEGTIKSNIHRGKQALRQLLEI